MASEIELPRRSGGGGPRPRRMDVPDAGDVRQARVQPDPGLRVPAGAFGVDVGDSLDKVGDAAMLFSRHVARAGERQQKLFDATKTTGGLLAFEREQTEEFQKSQVGQDTAHPDWLAATDKRLNDAKGRALAALDPGVSEQARVEYGLKLDQQINAFRKAAGQIALVSGEKQAVDQLQSLNNQRAAQARQNPETMDAVLTTYGEDVKPFEGRTTSDQARDSLSKGRRNIILAGIDGMVDKGRFREAEAKLKSGMYDADLGPEAYGHATASIQRGRARAAAEVGAQAPDHFASIAETGRGIPGLASKAAGVLEGEQLADFRAREARAQKTFGVIEGIRTAPPEEVAAKVASMQPRSGSTLYAEEARTYDQIAAEAKRMMKARYDNPAGYVIQNVPAVTEAFKAAEKTPGLLPDAINKSLAAQAAMGIEPEYQRVLPNAKGEVARISALPPEQAANAIEGMAAQYGKHWGRAYRELVEAKLSPEYVALATLDGPGDVKVRRELGDALKTGRKALEDALPVSTPKADLDKAVGGALEGWARVEQTRAGGATNVATMRNAVELLAYRYAVEGRSDPAGDAVKALITDRYDVLDTGNFALYVPKGRGADVESTGRRIIGGLTADNVMDPGGSPDLTPAQRKDEYLKQARRGRWVLDGSGTRAILLDAIGQPVHAGAEVSAVLVEGVPVVGFYLADATTDTAAPRSREGTTGDVRRTLQREVRP